MEGEKDKLEGQFSQEKPRIEYANKKQRTAYEQPEAPLHHCTF